MSLYLRKLTKKEKILVANLAQGGNTCPPEIKRRASIVYLASKGWVAPELAPQVGCHPNIARKWIKAFNRDGIRTMEPRRSSGSPYRISSKIRERIVGVALTNPLKLRLPFKGWSLSRLRKYLIRKAIVSSISRERLRQVLMENGFTYKQPDGWACEKGDL